MATRMYFPTTLAAFVTPPSPGAEWEHNNGVTRALLKTPDASALSTVSVVFDSADDLVDKDGMHRQYVSPRLKAQTLSGNVKAQFQYLEANAANNLSPTFVIKVISEDGTTVRATLLAITRDGTEINTALRNCTFASVALSSYACTDGDRLLVEVGIGGLPTAAGGQNDHDASIRFGCSASSGDLPEDDTETGTTFRPWIEFSNTFTFEDFPINAEAGSDTITGQAASLLRTLVLALTAGSYAKTGFSTTLDYHAFPQLSADPGSYGVSGSLAGLVKSNLLSVDAGSYSKSGLNASTLIGYAMEALAGAYAATGGPNTHLLHGYFSVVLPGSYAVSGNNASVTVGHLFAAMAGTLVISGASADLTYSGGGMIVNGSWMSLLGVGR